MKTGRGTPSDRSSELLIEGYASIFGEEDASGDIVRAGAFVSSLKDRNIPMLLQHRTGVRVGRWVRIVEDSYGLFVRGLINRSIALDLVKTGLSGLSIGFRPQTYSMRPDAGRVLSKIDLVEVSLVAKPMLDRARFQVIAGTVQ